MGEEAVSAIFGEQPDLLQLLRSRLFPEDTRHIPQRIENVELEEDQYYCVSIQPKNPNITGGGDIYYYTRVAEGTVFVFPSLNKLKSGDALPNIGFFIHGNGEIHSNRVGYVGKIGKNDVLAHHVRHDLLHTIMSSGTIGNGEFDQLATAMVALNTIA